MKYKTYNTPVKDDKNWKRRVKYEGKKKQLTNKHFYGVQGFYNANK